MQRFKAVAVIRVIMAVLFTALAATSFSSGRVLVGVLFGGLAVTNVAFVVVMRRRRNELRRRFPEWSGGHGPRGGRRAA